MEQYFPAICFDCRNAFYYSLSFWWSILPVPLFQDPYATVLFDREGQVMGMKVADDGQMRFEEVQDLPPRYVISVLVFEDRYF